MDGLKRYVNDDRFRVDGDKNMRLLAFAFTIVFVWMGSKFHLVLLTYIFCVTSLYKVLSIVLLHQSHFIFYFCIILYTVTVYSILT